MYCNYCNQILYSSILCNLLNKYLHYVALRFITFMKWTTTVIKYNTTLIHSPLLYSLNHIKWFTEPSYPHIGHETTTSCILLLHIIIYNYYFWFFFIEFRVKYFNSCGKCQKFLYSHNIQMHLLCIPNK